MLAALVLAGRALGRVAPNPAVGCVLVRDGRVVGRGWTQPGGRPHAETEALARAGDRARGATAYVSLEPCAHHGRTPPCAEALAAAGIARCVVALEDPDPRVAGKGMALLKSAGIAVEAGTRAEEAAELNAGFLTRLREGRPLVTLKLATTLDGRIATAAGESRWITGPAARARAHHLRATHDAVLVGGGTALADDPRLDVRLAGLEDRAPLRVVLDGRLRLPLSHDLVVRAPAQPTLLITGSGPGSAGGFAEARGRAEASADTKRRRAYEAAGVEVATVGLDAAGVLSLSETLKLLGGRGLTRLLVEGGGQVAASLLRDGLVDRLVWFRAPGVIGGDGLAAVAGLAVAGLTETPRFRRLDIAAVGEDMMETYTRLS